MTVLEIERLIRKMSELLQQGGNPDLAPKLAGDYASVCHTINLRLQQCEAMIKGDDRHQAIQLAETPPNLLDAVTILEFRDSDNWRAFCQQNALPVADRVDARSVQTLNDCYSQGIATDHPLYATYRTAVLHRDDEAALQALQSITRLNPADANAAAELVRLDAKVLGSRLEHLAGLLADGDPPVVVAAIEAIEAFGFKGRPEGEVWCKANGIRCVSLLEEAVNLKSQSQWAESLARLDFIRRLQTELQLQLPATALKQLDSLETWAREEQEKDRKEREFRLLLAELRFRVQQSEEKDTSARYIKLPELRDDFEALNKTWRSLTDFTRPIPDDASSAFSKRSALLEAEIVRRTTLRRRVIVASCAAVMLVGSVLAWFVLGRMKASDFAAQLRNAVSQRQVRVAETLLDRVRTSEKSLLNVADVNTAAAAADTFLTKEHALLAAFDAVFAKLSSRFAGDPDAATLNSIAGQLGQVHAALTALSPDLKVEKAPSVQAFEKQWQQFLSAGGAAVNSLYEQSVARAEVLCVQLDYRTPVETATSQISALAPIIQKLDECEAGFTNHISLRNDLLQRAAAARAKFRAFHQELRKLDQGVATLRKATALTEYSSAISLIASCEFSGSPAASASAAVQALGISDEATLRLLLGATNATTWAFLTKTRETTLFPEIAMPAETAMLQQLNEDPAVSAKHHRYLLWLDTQNTKSEEWITVGQFENSKGWKQIKAWTPSPIATSAAFQDKEYGYFDNQWKLSPTVPIFRLEEVVSRDETSSFASVGLNRVWSGGSSYGRPLLEVLDAVKDSHEGSPIFRAYLFCKLVELMELQPDAWGLSFCPSARAHAALIRNLVGGEIESGDWFVPSKRKSWSEKLDQFFAAGKPLSYAKQAGGNLALARSVVRGGLRYVGFADPDGKPIVTEPAPPAELLGYDAVRKQPVLVTGPVMPLSPLFALPAPRAEYLTKANVTADAPSFAEALPPLFRVALKP